MTERIEPTWDVPGPPSDRERFAVKGTLPIDLLTHREAWRTALELALTRAISSDDASYWQHELDTFDRVFSELETIKNNPSWCAGCDPDNCPGCSLQGLGDIPWIGCGECDVIFGCHNGKEPCIRLPRGAT